MNIDNIKKTIEKPIYSSLEELFTEAKLERKEMDIFLKYKKYCAYWLLRSKHSYSKSFDNHIPNFIQLLARGLINLDSDNVTGAKDKFLKEMFSDKTVHRVYKTKNGIRTTKNSPIIENKYFELEIMSYFLENDFYIELSESKILGQKIPEFKAIKGSSVCNIEAKKLNFESVHDNIFGDKVLYGVDYHPSASKKSEGYKRIMKQFSRNYEDALLKYYDTPNNEYFIIFMYAYYRLDLLGPYAINYINQLSNTWKEKKYNNLVGVVITDSQKTYLLFNKNCPINISESLNKIPLANFNKFLPKII